MPGDGSSVRDALNHQSLQVSRDDPGPRPMIAVLDARPGLAGRSARRSPSSWPPRSAASPAASPSLPTRPATYPAASTSTRSTPALPAFTEHLQDHKLVAQREDLRVFSRLLNGSSANTFATPR